MSEGIEDAVYYCPYCDGEISHVYPGGSKKSKYIMENLKSCGKEACKKAHVASRPKNGKPAKVVNPQPIEVKQPSPIDIFNSMRFVP